MLGKFVFCLDTGERFYFSSDDTVESALNKMLYTLSLSDGKAANVQLNETEKCKYFEYKGNTYASLKER